MNGDALLIVGNPAPFHVGAHFANAARAMGLRHGICNSDEAYAGNFLARKFNWHFRGHRPTRLRAFSENVVTECARLPQPVLLTTGIAPVSSTALARLRSKGVRVVNFLTDDPWNAAHRAEWFMQALPGYDAVFSPRKSNLSDLRALGCREVSYLPFGYSPQIHFPFPGAVEELASLRSDVLFAGGADADRLPYMGALMRAGLDVALYGHDWDRHSEFKKAFRGHAGPELMRKAVAAAKVCLCLVRRANRDGHAMRTFELAAMGACMLVEDSDEHREIFGAEGNAVLYFHSLEEMSEKAKWLCDDSGRARDLALAVHARITSTSNRYRDRLAQILCGAPPLQREQ